MWRKGLLCRWFATPPPRPSSWSRTVFVLGAAGVVYSGYRVYREYYGLPPPPETFVGDIEKAALSPQLFTGVVRAFEAAEVEKKLKESVVVLYHPCKSGKSALAQYLKSSAARPCLMLQGRGTIEAVIAQLYEPGASRWHIGAFEKTLAAGVQRLQNPLVIIDSAEAMPALLVERMVAMGGWLKERAVGDLLVVTNDFEVVKKACASEHYTDGDAQVHVLNDMGKSEFSALGEHLGLSSTDADAIYEEAGASVEVLQQAKSSASPSAYPKVLRQQFTAALATLLKEKPHLKDGVGRALLSISPLKPCGDVFARSEHAQSLLSLGLMVEFPNSSARFRNKLCISAVVSALS